MKYIIKNGKIINEGKIFEAEILIDANRIAKIAPNISTTSDAIVIDAQGKYIIPGIIDDQVHFREPGLTHKADISSESRAAVAGGITTFMEMPNTKPACLTQELLADKYAIASKSSYCNYSFFMGVSNDNYEEVMKTSMKDVCGIKIFMGSSTGNMLVDNESILEKIFANSPMLIATHCEDEHTVNTNLEISRNQYGDNIPLSLHPIIRDEKACYKSSLLASSLAQKHGTRLHILHISTADELALFENTTPLKDKKITSEVCVHHLYFDADDYTEKGSLIKCNPAIKDKKYKIALFNALLDNRLDIIATDHAPHTWEEKMNPYLLSPSGLPLVQHSLGIMLDFYLKGQISLERIVEKMCHAPAICFQIAERGYIREGYYADIAIIDLEKSYTVQKDNILYKCAWSPLEGQTLRGTVTHTFVSGNLVFDNGTFNDRDKGMRITFDR
jgi:dihydroorotase